MCFHFVCYWSARALTASWPVSMILTHLERWNLFRVAGRDRRADDDSRRVGGSATNRVDGGGALLAKDPHPATAQVLQHGVIPRIRAADAVATVRQDPRDGRHADAANSNEMEWLVAIKRQDQWRIQAWPETKPERVTCPLLAVHLSAFDRWGPDVPRWGGSANFCMIGGQIPLVSGSARDMP